MTDVSRSPSGTPTAPSRWSIARRWIGGAGFLLAIVAVALSVHLRSSADQQLITESEKARSFARELAEERSRETFTPLEVTRGSRFSDLLRRADLDAETTNAILEAARPIVDFRRLRPGQSVQLGRTVEGEFTSLRYRMDRDRELVVVRKGDKFEATAKAVPSTIETKTAQGQITSSLFEAVIEAGEHPELAVRLADIFAWDLDFYTDPRPGDTFRLVFEKITYGNGESPSYGKIFAARYDNAGHPYDAVLFHDSAGRSAYYSSDGKSMQKAFLRSPLKFAARVSSHYSRHRFHPVLKMYRPHLGTDYAAPVGTPVQAVAHGRVSFAGRRGGGGNTVSLRHANGYETHYLHLSRILVRRGQVVEQGKTIGLVGATGLATGPHLDFRVRKAGSFVNFERMKLPPTNPVAKKDMPEFEVERDRWMALLNTQQPGAVQASASPDHKEQTSPATR
jgi:murein DD-endopeptidase MepM/ murein hydrolase activator NlpD